MRKKLSNHVKLRNKERFGTSNKRIKDVMMYGYPPAYFEGDFNHYLESVKNAKGGAITVKVKDDMVVVYNKRSKIAVTTYKVPEKFMPIDAYLLPTFKKKVGDKSE